jgi:hypothetical protein
MPLIAIIILQTLNPYCAQVRSTVTPRVKKNALSLVPFEGHESLKSEMTSAGGRNVRSSSRSKLSSLLPNRLKTKGAYVSSRFYSVFCNILSGAPVKRPPQFHMSELQVTLFV